MNVFDVIREAKEGELVPIFRTMVAGLTDDQIRLAFATIARSGMDGGAEALLTGRDASGKPLVPRENQRVALIYQKIFGPDLTSREAMAAMIAGIPDALDGDTKVSDDDIREILTRYGLEDEEVGELAKEAVGWSWLDFMIEYVPDFILRELSIKPPLPPEQTGGGGKARQ